MQRTRQEYKYNNFSILLILNASELYLLLNISKLAQLMVGQATIGIINRTVTQNSSDIDTISNLKYLFELIANVRNLAGSVHAS